MARVVFDESQHPLVVITWPAEYSTDDVVTFIGEMKALVLRRQRIAVLNDVLRTRAPTALERKKIAEGVQEARDFFRDYVAGWSDVLGNPFIRGVITALRWLTPDVYPHQVHATFEEGEAWCRAQLAGESARRSHG